MDVEGSRERPDCELPSDVINIFRITGVMPSVRGTLPAGGTCGGAGTLN